MLAVGVLLFTAPVLAQESVPNDDVTQEALRFARVYGLVEKHYMNPLNPDAAILEGAIRAMLSTLDPFSSFFNPDQFKLLQEQSRGRAMGFGTVLYVTPAKVVVLEAAENSPARRAGLGPGDEIVEVNGQRLDRLDLRSLIQVLEQARSHPVNLGIVHPGKVLPEYVKLNPAEMDLPTVDKAFLYKPGIAYVHLTSFEQKTPQEVLDALKRMGGADLEGLLLDLRDNHGGIIASAVSTVSLFLPPGLAALSVEGRAQSEVSYPTVKAPARFDMPIVVLVNGNTASAAEIAAAGLEEHDRAVIAGEPTYGKGVVEHLSPLSEKTGLALTVAQYFTPSGRSIQRPLPGTALADPQKAAPGQADSSAFHTDNGRAISAGGGITPDVEILSRRLDPWATFLDQRGFFTNFASEYLTRHGRISKSFEPGEETLSEFHDYLNKHGIRAPEEYWNQDLGYLKLRIKTELFNLVFGLAVGNEVETRGDPQVEKAAALFPRVPELLKPPAEKASTLNPQRAEK